jgi:hypothetical protein
MSFNRQQFDYTQRYQIRTGRLTFADYVQRRQLVQDGYRLGLNICPPDNDASIISIIKEGEVNTTPEELARYLAEIRREELQPGSSSAPDPPTNLIGTSGDGRVTISFTPGNDNGSPIINYEYIFPDASGAGFEPFNPPTGPVSSLTFTGLQNGQTYQIQLKAVNVNGPSSATSSFYITPVPGGSNLVLYLDGANGNDVALWKDTSGKLENATLYNAPAWSSANGGYYTFNGTNEYGQVPSGFADFTSGITILAFVKFTSVVESDKNWNRILDFGNGENDNNILFGRRRNVSDLTLHVFNDATNTIFNLTNGLIENEWGFYIARLNRETFLIKNQNISRTGSATVLPLNIERINNFIGKSNWSADSLFKGDMGIIAMYNTALTDGQINAFFDLYKGRYFNAPSEPTITSITNANTSLTVNFTAPISNGGVPITDYEYSTNGGTTWSSGGTIASPIRITGLTNGISYTVILRAVNSIGGGAPSSPVLGTPVATLASFTTVGTTSWTAPTGIYSVEYLVVGGGGGSGGGYDNGGGAGGGGGMVRTGTLSVSPGTSYTIQVGDGGIAGTSNRDTPSETQGGSGANSRFGTITSLGGGGGYSSRQPSGSVNGNGGSAASNPSTASTGGNGGGADVISGYGGGGGGGASGAGSNRSGTTGGTGGAGISSSISGLVVTYGVGGRGANGSANYPAVAGIANTGNGAVGGGQLSFSQTNGAKGGSGIVIVNY